MVLVCKERVLVWSFGSPLVPKLHLGTRLSVQFHFDTSVGDSFHGKSLHLAGIACKLAILVSSPAGGGREARQTCVLEVYVLLLNQKTGA